MQEDGDFEENPPEERGECSVAAEPHNGRRAGFEEKQECLSKGNGNLYESQSSPHKPQRALAGPSEPAHAQSVELHPRVLLHNLGLEPIAAASIDGPDLSMLVQTLEQGQSGIDVPPCPASTDENSSHKKPFVQCCPKYRP